MLNVFLKMLPSTPWQALGEQPAELRPAELPPPSQRIAEESWKLVTCVSLARWRRLSRVLHPLSRSTWPPEALCSSFHTSVEGLSGTLNRRR